MLLACEIPHHAHGFEVRVVLTEATFVMNQPTCKKETTRCFLKALLYLRKCLLLTTHRFFIDLLPFQQSCLVEDALHIQDLKPTLLK